jgi:hypothetical protein
MSLHLNFSLKRKFRWKNMKNDWGLSDRPQPPSVNIFLEAGVKLERYEDEIPH